MTTRRTDRRAPLYALLAVAAVGTLARFLALGDRMAHWDEARLGYDVLRYAATGVFEYRPVTHGPLLYHVDRALFELLGASDFVARFPVAVVGGLLPLAAWLYRDHLRNLAVVVLGVLLAANPVLVYYSRFFRNDVLVAAFAFTALGLLVRTRDTGDARYLYGASAFGALAFASKPNALLYAGLWVGAALVVLDQRALVRAFEGRPVFDMGRGASVVAYVRERGTPEMALVAILNPLVLVLFGPFSVAVTAVLVAVVALVSGVLLHDAGRIADRNAVAAVGTVLAASLGASVVLGDPLAASSGLLAFAFAWVAAAAGALGVFTEHTVVGRRIRRWRAPVTLATLAFVAITLVLFAPRNPDGLGLWSALADPSQLPALVEAGLVTPLEEYGRVWFSGYRNDFLTYAVVLARTLASVVVVVVVAGGLGFVANRYGDRDDVVEFSFVWAGLSVLVYPVAVLVNAPWHAVHVVVPLAVPAAVAIAHVVRYGQRGVRDRDVAVAGVAVLVCCVAFAAPLTTAAGTAYLHPQSEDNQLVQYGQPSDDFRDTLERAQAAAAENANGTDVLYYGAYFHVDNDSVTNRLPVGDLYTAGEDDYDLVGENEAWYNRLPLAWYFEQFGAITDSADRRPALDAHLQSDPPVVVTRTTLAENVSALLGPDYRRSTFNLTQRNVSVTVFVNEPGSRPARPDVDDGTDRSSVHAGPGAGSPALPSALRFDAVSLAGVATVGPVHWRTEAGSVKR